ncbi:MAG: GDP-mannose 4,6-dehydratase [Ignavibacteria bacterium]|nr:GDP-mannose 4,6-dehydratase [Ignavibacteria bacterium]MBK7253615.1 GDP-mannose 4,6-dehydratase [Ignavibacteria bacterium]MBK7445699.1 GDP-mannose 4,6-dehydratase [Ignavibacteria bacterium]MBK8382404.1 GDP-mannose 4,6-dehydratase [Ignavibacteria bacterium]MBK9404260.1 GDP-mannose 4,6-dehydratase [Ignavibacteria bacterium]
MQRYIITGVSGFVGKNFIKYLNANIRQSEILGIDIRPFDIHPENYEHLKFKFERSDLKDKDTLCKLIYNFRPDFILHLASYSSVAGSWKSPNTSFLNNVNIFLNLIESVRMIGLKCRILSVGSSEEYGSVKIEDLPLKESNQLNPSSPFGVARVTQELLSRLYADVYGLDIVITRSFNHIGPGQNENYAVASFAKQLVEVRKNKLNEFLSAGDVSIVRDFIDVRDVVCIYHKLLLNGKKGEIYNVCSGYGVSLRNIIQMICEILEVNISIKQDLKLKRPKDNPVIIGCNEKIKREINWTNEFSLERSLKDVVQYYMHQ